MGVGIIVTPRIYLSHPATTGPPFQLLCFDRESPDVYKQQEFERTTFTPKSSTLIINITQPSLNTKSQHL